MTRRAWADSGTRAAAVASRGARKSSSADPIPLRPQPSRSIGGMLKDALRKQDSRACASTLDL